MAGVPKDLLNQYKERWSDLDSNFSLDGRGGIKTVVNVEAVKASIDNIISTRRGERVMRRSFGTGLEDFIFENISEDLSDFLASRVKQVIEANDDRVIITDTRATQHEDDNTIKLLIVFQIKGYDGEYIYEKKLGGA